MISSILLRVKIINGGDAGDIWTKIFIMLVLATISAIFTAVKVANNSDEASAIVGAAVLAFIVVTVIQAIIFFAI